MRVINLGRLLPVSTHSPAEQTLSSLQQDQINILHHRGTFWTHFNLILFFLPCVCNIIRSSIAVIPVFGEHEGLRCFLELHRYHKTRSPASWQASSSHFKLPPSKRKTEVQCYEAIKTCYTVGLFPHKKKITNIS